MTLDEMLALLADNTTGDISAADLRDIVTGLYDKASKLISSHPYRWATGVPATGKLSLDQGWSMASTVLSMSETTDDGVTIGFGVLDQAASADVVIGTDTQRLDANVTGPSVDQGTYRDIPIQVTAVSGAAPTNNAAVTLLVEVTTAFGGSQPA